MKLPDMSQPLDAVRRAMGAPLVTWSPAHFFAKTPDIGHQPIEREITDLSQLAAGDGDTIVFEGRRVFLYIREFRTDAASFDEASAEPQKLRKFHIAWCETLQGMKDKGKFERYVVSTKADAPFGIALRMPDDSWQRGYANLAVCRNCLKHVNWEGYEAARHAEKKRIVQAFSRRRFLATAPTHFAALPSRYDTDPFALGYAPDWAERSRRYRESRNWRCEACGVDCSGNRNLLDTHHRNSVTSDNTAGNLQALCKLCHAKEHRTAAGDWYRVSADDSHRITQLRIAQSLPA